MRLVEAAKGAFQSVFQRDRVIPAPRKKSPEATFLTFPGHKTDFSDGAHGTSGFDLANAFAQKVVKPLDILEITTESSPPDDEGRGTTLIYLEPGPLFFGANGYHTFLAELQHSVIREPITSWKKVGTLLEKLKALSDNSKASSPKPLF